jgi:hypothetical protein
MSWQPRLAAIVPATMGVVVSIAGAAMLAAAVGDAFGA